MTPDRERMAKMRKARKDAGLVRIPETWVPADKLEAVKAAIERELGDPIHVARVGGEK